jgi:hypothetical protein
MIILIRLFLCLSCIGLVCGAEPNVTVSTAEKGQDGFSVHEIESPYQAGKTTLRVLLPDVVRPGQRCRIIYVLPVEAGLENRYGDGLLEVKKQDLHNKYETVFAAPTFSHLPWYADHPITPTIRQETYFLKVVVPFIEQNYPVTNDMKGRLLVGFSKSGWGAWSLLLRHPDVFGAAAAWDAPMMMDRLGKYGTTDIFSSQEIFEEYRISELLRKKQNVLGGAQRLVLTGFGGFRQDHDQIHSLLVELKIPHVYRDGPARKHDWHSGWLPEAVELLMTRERHGASHREP